MDRGGCKTNYQQPQMMGGGGGGGGGNWNQNCPNTPCFPDPAMGGMNQMGPSIQGFPPQGDGCFNPSGMMPPMGPGQSGIQFNTPQSVMFNPVAAQSGIPCSECNMMFGPPGGPSFNAFGQQQQQQPPCCNPDTQMTPCVECGTLLAPQFKQVEEAQSAPVDPPGNYQEIGASMGGNALTIRVHRDKAKIEQVRLNKVNLIWRGVFRHRSETALSKLDLGSLDQNF